MPATPSDGAEHAGRRRSARRSARAWSSESANVGSRNVVEHVVDLRDLHDAADRPPAPRACPSRPSSARSRSAMWCSGPGKPTSVSSTSPVAGLRRHLGVVQVAVLELARLGHGLAPEGAEDHPPRVDGGQERADVAGDVERPLPAALARRGRAGSRPWRRSRRTAGSPASARPPMTKQPKVNGIARRKPPIRSRFCSPAIAPMTEPAAMNSSALKKACVMRWNSPATYAPALDAHDHVADLRHRRVGDDALEVGDDEADRPRDQQRDRADDGADAAAVGASSNSGCMRAIR